MNTREAFLYIVLIMAALRLVELVVAQRNLRWARAQGGIEVGAGHYPWMVLQHTAFLIAAPLEVWLLDRPWIPQLAWTMVLVLVAAMGLRYWAISTLGKRWTTRVVCVPNLPAVTSGPYRFLRHPNYLAVILEIAALPLVHSAWLTAVIFSLLNAWMLKVRIEVEERAMNQYNDYRALMEGRRRLVPTKS